MCNKLKTNVKYIQQKCFACAMTGLISTPQYFAKHSQKQMLYDIHIGHTLTQ